MKILGPRCKNVACNIVLREYCQYHAKNEPNFSKISNKWRVKISKSVDEDGKDLEKKFLFPRNDLHNGIGASKS